MAAAVIIRVGRNRRGKILDYVGGVFKGGSADVLVCQFGLVFHLPSVHVPAYAGPCHKLTKQIALREKNENFTSGGFQPKNVY